MLDRFEEKRVVPRDFVIRKEVERVKNLFTGNRPVSQAEQNDFSAYVESISNKYKELVSVPGELFFSGNMGDGLWERIYYTSRYSTTAQSDRVLRRTWGQYLEEFPEAVNNDSDYILEIEFDPDVHFEPRFKMTVIENGLVIHRAGLVGASEVARERGEQVFARYEEGFFGELLTYEFHYEEQGFTAEYDARGNLFMVTNRPGVMAPHKSLYINSFWTLQNGDRVNDSYVKFIWRKDKDYHIDERKIKLEFDEEKLTMRFYEYGNDDLVDFTIEFPLKLDVYDDVDRGGRRVTRFSFMDKLVPRALEIDPMCTNLDLDLNWVRNNIGQTMGAKVKIEIERDITKSI